MSDPATPTQTTGLQDIAKQIASAPERVWTKIRDLLRVKTRQEAAQIVAQDANAAEAVANILGGGEDILMRRSKPGESVLTAKRTARSPEGVLYPGMKGGLSL